MGTSGVSRIVGDLQKVVLGDSMPHLCSRVRLEELVSGGVVTVTDPVSINLKDLDRGEYLVFNQVVDLQVRAEGGTLVVEGESPAVGNVDST